MRASAASLAVLEIAVRGRGAAFAGAEPVGVHADAQLFEWITNGFPGSRMPAFKTALSDTDRWHLVNFIRTLAPK